MNEDQCAICGESYAIHTEMACRSHQIERLEEQLAAVTRERDVLARERGELPDGVHPDEAKPRAATWLAERANWIVEVESLRETLAACQRERDDWRTYAELCESAMYASDCEHNMTRFCQSHGVENWEGREQEAMWAYVTLQRPKQEGSDE